MNTCSIHDVNECNYTVVCEYHAGSARLPECFSEPYVIFNISNTYSETLGTGFFGSTNFDSRVREINAVNSVWSNIESTAFRFYSKTRFMDLSRTHIANIKSEAFLNLHKLEKLNLSGNVIESIRSRTFVVFPYNVTTNFEVIDLSFNNITQISEDFSTFLLKLKELYLQHNQLSSLNSSFESLKSLKVLDVSHNSLKKLIGSEINRLTALEYINMSHNAIETIDSNCFNQAFDLVSVDLSFNRIKSPIEVIMFINNNRLTYLNLFENSITTIQDNAFEHNNLTFLNIAKNKLSMEITEKTFNGLQYQTLLDLSNQNITMIRTDSFKFSGLIKLNLSSSYVSNIENGSFAKAYSLSVLDLSNNQNILNVNFLNNCLFNLTELYLKNNSLTVIPKTAFDNKFLLKTLDISLNKIMTIEQNSLPLKSLQYLNIGGNSMAGTLQSNIFSPGMFLRYLDLSYFKLSKVDEMAFVDLPVLTRLNVSHCMIKQFNENNFKNMDNMFSLDLSYNELSSFYINSSLSKCQALYLNNNKLTDVSKLLENMTSLFYVDLTHNYIKDLSTVPFSKLPNIKVLHLSFNLIQTFNNPEINSLKSLTDLTLSSNLITTINLSYFPDLVLVDLSNNSISNINITFFKNLDNLQALDLSNNKITDIAPGTFQNVRILKLLNLSHNKLSKIRYGTFKGLNKTGVLDLSYNQLEDIDVYLFHECYELKSLKIDYNIIKSFDVDRLIHITPSILSVSLGGNKMSCKEIVVNKYKYEGRVEVTSIDKIYHEDNVHGIVCGDGNATITTEHTTPEPKIVPQETSSVLVAFCIILTILVIFVAGAAVWYRRNRFNSFDNQSRMQLRGSVNFEGIEQQHDLLG